jgi:hypothetical protein
MPVPPMPDPVVEHGPSVDGDQNPFEQTADVEPLGKPELHMSVADVPLANGPTVPPANLDPE